MEKHSYNPDVLNCLANLSNDEVFTPPELANRMLDLLPQELFSDPKATFLDPFTKSDVFLREVVKRLDVGLATVIPDRQQRIDHIMHRQVYGIAITELTAHLSRRSLYCSRCADSPFSVSHFDAPEGNIQYRPLQHTWQGGKCRYCGASQSVYDRPDTAEQHAYQFIHTAPPQSLFPKDMKFDVIIGNPPYQLGVGNEGGNSAKAKAIYHHFVSQAIRLSPCYLLMIIPSRWMTKSTEGIPDSWVEGMLYSNKILTLHDFPNSDECFPGLRTPIKGGICYFLWNKDYSGKCKYIYHNPSTEKKEERYDYLDPNNAGIVIRDPQSQGIINRIASIEGDYFKSREHNFSALVSPKDFFTNKVTLTSSWTGYTQEKVGKLTIKHYLNRNIHKAVFGYVALTDISKHTNAIPLHKVYIPAAGGTGTDDMILGTPFYGEPNSVCSQTYLVIGYDPNNSLSKEECDNVITYIKTKLFRYLVSIKKKTQNGPRDVYQFVPLQDFSHPWTDEMLYKKYGLNEQEMLNSNYKCNIG